MATVAAEVVVAAPQLKQKWLLGGISVEHREHFGIWGQYTHSPISRGENRGMRILSPLCPLCRSILIPRFRRR
jgi:hypothetical protein